MACTHYSIRTALKYAKQFDVKINPFMIIYLYTTTGDKIFKKMVWIMFRQSADQIDERLYDLGLDYETIVK